MKCEKCKEDKLPKEFPSEHLTEECADEHPLLHCLRVRMYVDINIILYKCTS